METKKKKVGFIILIIALVIIILGLVGYIYYDKYMAKEEPNNETEEVVKDEGFYSVDNLVENNYIKEVTGVADENNLVKIKDGAVYYKKYSDSVINDLHENQELIKSTSIVGTPKSVFARLLGMQGPRELFVLTEEGDIYYFEQWIEYFDEDNNKTVTENTDTKDFVKVNSKKVVKMYTGYLSSEIDVYAEFEDHSLYAFDELKFTETYKDYNNYVDSQQAIATGGNLIYFMNDSKNLYYPEYNEQTKKFDYIKVMYEDEQVVVKDLFGNQVSSDSYYYVVDKDNNLLKLNNKKTTLYKNSKVKDVKYENKTNNDFEYIITVTFEDGSSQVFKNCLPSSLYLRANPLR